jgi:hypothetical protein
MSSSLGLVTPKRRIVVPPLRTGGRRARSFAAILR